MSYLEEAMAEASRLAAKELEARMRKLLPLQISDDVLDDLRGYTLVEGTATDVTEQRELPEPK